MSPEHAYPKSRFEPDSRSARLNAAPHRRAPALTPSPPTLNRWLGTRRLRPTALVHRGRRPSRKVERIRKSDSRLRALLRGGPVFDKITPECERTHRASARHPFQYYYRRFGVGSCVSSQTLLPGGLKPTGPQTVAEESFPESGKWPERSGGRWGRHGATNDAANNQTTGLRPCWPQLRAALHFAERWFGIASFCTSEASP